MKSFDRSFIFPRVGRMEQIASIRRLVSDDGKGRGMRVLDVNSGSGLSFTVYPDRGMDIGQTYYNGMPLAWMSSNNETAPQFYDPEGLEWLRTWGGGLLTGCGLVNVGDPNTVNGENHGLHGRLSHIPAEEVNTSAGWTNDGTYALTVSGRMRHSKVFGEKIVITRTITTVFGDPSIIVRDTIENQGFTPTPLMLLYHLNLGWPLVSEDATLQALPHEVSPQNAHSAASLDAWPRMTTPVHGFKGQVFYHTLPADKSGLASISLINPHARLAFRVTYRVAELPYLIQWKMMGEGEYAMGLEPANCYPEGQEAVARRGLLRSLKAGEKTETFLKLSVEPLT